MFQLFMSQHQAEELKFLGLMVTHPGRFIPGRKTQYPIYRRMSGAQGQSGQVRKFLPHQGLIPGMSNP
jgi:hypothetical protein